jgi:hypothetical protein
MNKYVPILFFLLARAEHLWNNTITAVHLQPKYYPDDRRAPVIFAGVI